MKATLFILTILSFIGWGCGKQNKSEMVVSGKKDSIYHIKIDKEQDGYLSKKDWEVFSKYLNKQIK